MSNVDIRLILDPLLNQLEEERSIDIAEKIISELVGLMGIKVSDRFLLNVPRIDAELSRFMLAPGFGRQAAAYDIPNDHADLIDLKLFWIKKTTKTNLSWLIGITPNFEDSEANDYKNISIDFIFPESADRLIVLISDKFKIRSLELKDHITHTQFEIFSNWGNINLALNQDVKESKKIIHSHLWESFNFEPINRAFYLDLVESFSLLVHHLEKAFGRKPAVMFTTRLIGRLLFLWFLKKKGFINQDFLYFQVDDPSDQTEYYSTKLEVLFFDILNKEVPDRSSLDSKTPYLNGGLFDTNETDFYKNENLSFPPGFFSNLFKTLNKYNFTVDESSPEFQHVAIDPEMLGRIFESLLAEQIDEVTGSSKKKVTGAFYTPREIVSYMCEESLIEFLKQRLPELPDKNQRIEELVRLPETIFRDQDQNKRRDWKPYSDAIMKALLGNGNESFTVLDPAVGSGAFPMGMLQLLVKVFGRLDPKYEKNIASLKRDILSKSLYGVDVEQTAIEICRLRAWLSIIVDTQDVNHVLPLPNLDFKFACANTLIPLDEGRQGPLMTDYQLKDKLMAIRDEYFNTSNKKKKTRLQNDYYSFTHTDDMFDSLRTRQLKSYKPFDIGATSDFYDPDLHHGVKYFDLIIGNPPYVQIQKFSKQKIQKDLEQAGFETFVKTGDLYCLFFEKGLSLLKQGGLLTFITSNKWMRAGYGEKTRNFFLKNNPILLLDLGPNVFDSATVDTNILFIKREKYGKQLQGLTITQDWRQEGVFSKYIDEKKVHLKNISSGAWTIGDDSDQELKNKIEISGKKIKKWDLKIYRGILTGLNKAFLVDKETKDRLISEHSKSAELIKPVLRGKDIGTYKINFSELYLLMTGFDTDIQNKYPAIYSHLKQYEDKAKVRDDQGKNWFNLRSCGYYQDFEKEKIVFQEIVRSPQFYLDQSGKYYCEASAFFMTGKNLTYLVGMLNSKPIAYFFKKFYAGGGLGEAGFRYKKKFLEDLPIPEYDPSSKFCIAVEDCVDKIIQANKMNAKSCTSDNESKIDALIYEYYKLNDDQIRNIELSIVK
jgi:hypothetical protein